MEEAFPSRFTKAIRAFWRRSKYQKLEAGGGTKTAEVARLGAGASRRRAWKVRPVCRIKVGVPTPRGILGRLRDAYVNSMLVLAGQGSGLVLPNGPEKVWPKRIPKSKSCRTERGVEFEQRMVVEIFKSLVNSGEIASHLKAPQQEETPRGASD